MVCRSSMLSFLLSEIVFHYLKMLLLFSSCCKFRDSKLIGIDLQLLHVILVVSASLVGSFKLAPVVGLIGFIKPRAFVLIFLAWGHCTTLVAWIQNSHLLMVLAGWLFFHPGPWRRAGSWPRTRVLALGSSESPPHTPAVRAWPFPGLPHEIVGFHVHARPTWSCFSKCCSWGLPFMGHLTLATHLTVFTYLFIFLAFPCAWNEKGDFSRQLSLPNWPHVPSASSRVACNSPRNCFLMKSKYS